MTTLTNEEKVKIALDILTEEQLDEFNEEVERQEKPNVGGIKLQEFNDCPGAMEISHQLNDRIKVEDGKWSYWQNCEDTLVVSIDKDHLIELLNMGKIATEMLADEFDWMCTDDRVFFRLWWD